MLWIGLTGGIGSGKSTVAQSLLRRGAQVIDADQLARDVVATNSPGLAEVVDRFGAQVLTENGELDRPALGRIVFDDDRARKALEEITHPRILELTAARRRELPEDAITVHDIPLLVEMGLAPRYHLVVVVGTDAQIRTNRLRSTRGMPEQEIRSRIAAQASDEQRRAVADVWLDNDGSPGELEGQVDHLWRRLTAFAANLGAGRVARTEDWDTRDARERVEPQGSRDRLTARLEYLFAGTPVLIRSPSRSVPDERRPAGDSSVAEPPLGDPIVDLSVSQVTAELRRRLAVGGFPAIDSVTHGSADPGRRVVLRWVGAT